MRHLTIPDWVLAVLGVIAILGAIGLEVKFWNQCRSESKHCLTSIHSQGK